MAINFTALNNACKLYYSMDNADVSGSTILDLTPNNNDGTINGATTGVSGVLNEALSFDGSNDYIDSNTLFRPTNNFFISFWLKKDSTNSKAFISTRDGDFSGIELGNSSSNFVFRVQGNTYVTPGGELNTGTYQHIVYAYDGTDRIVYVDNVEVGRSAYSASITSGGNLEIGRREFAAVYLDGDIDEVVVLQDYTSSGTTSELVDYYYNQGAPTIKQQYPMSPNTETLELDTLNLTSSLQDITFNNTIKEDLDTLTFNTNLQDVEIKKTIQFTLDPLQFNLGLNDVEFVSDVYLIKGIVTLKGSPIQNAIVRLINQTDNLYVEHFETGTDGRYEFRNLLSNKKYHTIVEYKDPQENKYNAKSYPFLIPIKEEQ